MTSNDIKKALYKEKPMAKHNVQFVDKPGGETIAYGYYATSSLGTHYFRVPLSEMGDTLFEDDISAQLLIRWLMLPEQSEEVAGGFGEGSL